MGRLRAVRLGRPASRARSCQPVRSWPTPSSGSAHSDRSDDELSASSAAIVPWLRGRPALTYRTPRPGDDRPATGSNCGKFIGQGSDHGSDASAPARPAVSSGERQDGREGAAPPFPALYARNSGVTNVDGMGHGSAFDRSNVSVTSTYEHGPAESAEVPIHFRARDSSTRTQCCWGYEETNVRDWAPAVAADDAVAGEDHDAKPATTRSRRRDGHGQVLQADRGNSALPARTHRR